tara:strand:+ start:189 stop:494 length:306 start_codon:yes stop_codon:yes gene_type:complete
MRDLRKNMLASSIKKVNKERQRGDNMIGTQLQNKHNGRRITITEKVISDTGNVLYVGEGDEPHQFSNGSAVLDIDDMKHWFEISTIRINRKPKYMDKGEEE